MPAESAFRGERVQSRWDLYGDAEQPLTHGETELHVVRGESDELPFFR